MTDSMDALFKALADATRRSLLDRRVANNGLSLSELCAELSMTRQAVTKHVRILEEANLVVPVWRGREKLHYLNAEPIEAIAGRWIGKYQRQRVLALRELKHALEGESNEQG